MSSYPRMLYKQGGTNPEPVQNGVLGTKIVYDAEQEDEAATDGWLRTTAEAFDAGKPKEQTDDVPEPVVDHADSIATDQANRSMTREELEAKAAELDLKYDGRISDKKLAAAVSHALSNQPTDHK